MGSKASVGYSSSSGTSTSSSITKLLAIALLVESDRDSKQVKETGASPRVAAQLDCSDGVPANVEKQMLPRRSRVVAMVPCDKSASEEEPKKI